MEYFSASVEYRHETVYRSDSLVEITRYAAAAALHTGRRFAVNRVVEVGPDPRVVPLFAVSPTSFDYRQVSAETALAMKAMAHDLVSNIDQVAPVIPTEGPTR